MKYLILVFEIVLISTLISCKELPKNEADSTEALNEVEIQMGATVIKRSEDVLTTENGLELTTEEHSESELLIQSEEKTVIYIPNELELKVWNSHENNTLKDIVLGDDEVIMFPVTISPYSTEYYHFYDTLYMIGSSGEVLHQLSNIVALEDFSGVFNIKQKKMMGIYLDGEIVYGLYDFNKMDWDIEPIYLNAWQPDEGYICAEKNDEILILDVKGDIILQVPNPDDQISYNKYGEYFIFNNFIERTCCAYDLNGIKIVDEIYGDVTGFGSYLVVNNNENNEGYLVNKNGDIVLEKVPSKDIEVNMPSMDEKDDSLIYTIDGITYNYDRNLNLIGNQYSLYFISLNNAYCSFEEGGIRRFYWKEGNEITSPTGRHYDDYLGDWSEDKYYLEREVNEGTEVLDIQTKKTYKIPYNSLYYFSVSESGQYFTVEGWSQTKTLRFYDENGTNTLTIEGDWFYKSNGLIFMMKEYEMISDFYCSYVTVVDGKGNIVYKSKYKEIVKPFSDGYLSIRRGNYVGFIDYEGNWIFRVVSEDY